MKKILFGNLSVGDRCTTEFEQNVIKTTEVISTVANNAGVVIDKRHRNAINLETGEYLLVDPSRYVWVEAEETPVSKEVTFADLLNGETCRTEYNENIMKTETIRLELEGGPDYRNAVNLDTGKLMLIDDDQKVYVSSETSKN